MMMKNNQFVALSPGNLLWEQISNFHLDEPDIKFPFSKKLAREQRWSEDFTRQAIQEYKRFIYLCCISPTGASPSEIVDKVWHQHLLYTQNYWEAFCEKTLGKKIHHYPSGGGRAEQQRHGAWQEDTLQLYRRCFGEDPPEAIWLNKSPSITGSLLKRFTLFPRRWLTSLLFFSFFFFTGCTSDSAPFFGYTTVLLFIGLLIAKSNNKKTKVDSDGDSGGSSCSSGSSCGSSCGSGCGGGCGGCGS
jgi:hypothetical protein